MARKPKEFIDHPTVFADSPTYRAFCTYVVDGDTIDVFIDLGLYKYAYETIRIQDLNTPEIFRPETEEERAQGFIAKEFVESKILNKQIKIQTEKDKQSFGRFIAKVFYYEEDQWKSLSEELTNKGLNKDEIRKY